MPKIDMNSLTLRTGSGYPAPYDQEMTGRSSYRLGDAGGLTQFGANLVILQPGAKSSLRHWHEKEDEFLIVTQGSLTLIEDQGETLLSVGDSAAFTAGVANGHHLINNSSQEARFLVIGTRARHEIAQYSDVDMRVTIDNGHTVFTRQDGSPIQETP